MNDNQAVNPISPARIGSGDADGSAYVDKLSKWRGAAEALAGVPCRRLDSGETLEKSDIYSNDSFCRRTEAAGTVIRHVHPFYFRPLF